MAIEIRVPTLGESVTEASIGQWFKKVGEAVKADEPLVELETDKVTLEVPAPSAGVLIEIVAAEGETVGVDALLASFSEGGAGDAVPATKVATPAVAAAPAASPKADTGKSALVDVVVPSGGESVTEAEVGEWYKKVGDPIAIDDAIVELETDKAAQEVMAQTAGVLEELVTPTGTIVEVGAVLARIRVGASVATISAAGAKVVVPEARTDMPASPAASRLMAENKISADSVSGSGKRGQVLKEDVMAAMDKISATPAAVAPVASSPVVVATPAASGGDEVREERVRMTRLRQTIARRLKDAQNSAAMLTTFNEVDMGPVMNLRKQYKELFEKKHGVKLGFMGFFTKAICHALREVPAVNAEIDGTDLVYKNYAHIGVAVGTAKGLVVPVVRDADQMSIAQIEQEIGNLGRKARDGSLSMSDMQGGTFTVSNGGVYGSLMSTPILNAPQSGILGMHKIQDRAMVVGGEIVVRSMMYLALSYDHRIVDGKEAVTFLVRVKESLEDPQRLVLDL
jgi:2-oxoglutarate dehydrogenase E2 component (dihydrolipoamide succinyltransferase)